MRGRACVDAHFAQTVKDSALDAVVCEGGEGDAAPWVEALGGFDESHVAVGNQVAQVNGHMQVMHRLDGERADIRAVLLDELVAVDERRWCERLLHWSRPQESISKSELTATIKNASRIITYSH